MGDFTEHILFGLLMAAVLGYFANDFFVLNGLETLAASLAIVIGAVLPDIDHKNSYVHRSVKAFSSIGAALLVLVFLPMEISQRYIVAVLVLLTVYFTFSWIRIRHRGFTHSISFASIVSSVVVLAGVLFFASAVPGIALGLGLLSHLVLDREFKWE